MIDGLETQRFHKRKVEWGYDKFLPLKTFNNGSNGYLLDDKCEFGAEVFICKEMIAEKGESLIMIKDAIPYKYTWHIDKFSELVQECYDSEPFNAGNYKWYTK